MLRLLWYAAALAAVIFIVGSATTNAMFLASLGRTATEAAVYAAISVAADLAKVVLPVAIGAAVVGRKWLIATLCGMLLAAVVGLSVLSGTGFAALTRGSVMAVRDATAATLVALETEHRGLVQRLSRLTAAREPAIVAAALDVVTSDRRWQASKQCTEVSGAAIRQFCAEARGLRVEAIEAQERDRLQAEEQVLRARLAAVRTASGASVSDPQVAALAELVGWNADQLRASLGLSFALVMELGAIVLVLLVAGPLLRGDEERRPSDGEVKPAETKPVELMPQVDRSFWERQRKIREGRVTGGGNDSSR